MIIDENDNLIIQKRPNKNDYALNIFGGHIEKNETPIQAMIREIKEELCAEINPEDVIFIGAITEEFTNHQDIVYTYFWKDKKGSIKDCYEFEKVIYEDSKKLLKEPKLMDYTYWVVKEAIKRKLIK